MDDQLEEQRDELENSPLLHDRPPIHSRPSGWKKLVVAALMTLLICSAVALTAFVTHSANKSLLKRPRHVIFMISDGMGPNSLSLTRSYEIVAKGLELNYTLPLDSCLVGTSRTRSSDSLITDSAAGATAFSCAIKTYNGAIAINPDGLPCATVMEAAKHAGYRTGMVVTSHVTDATPASFSAHAGFRLMEDIISRQLIFSHANASLDLLFGGGRCKFLPNSDKDSCRLDDENLIDAARHLGYSYISKRKQIADRSLQLPVLGLFGEYRLPFEIDRTKEDPTLAEMTERALELLLDATDEDPSQPGFFLMVEGSLIDIAAHANDPAAHVQEVVAYNDAWKVVQKFIDQHGGVVVSTSDHETGGLAVGRQQDPNVYPDYAWYPEKLTGVRHSINHLSRLARKYQGEDFDKFIEKKILADGLGIKDATKAELSKLYADRRKSSRLRRDLADMINVRANIGWSTRGHTAADVNIYAYGDTQFDAISKNIENIEIGQFLKKLLKVDLQELTTRLQEDNDTSWYDPDNW